MALPLLYKKLLANLQEYLNVDNSPANSAYVMRRDALTRDICRGFRITKKELPKLLKELEGMKRVKRISQRKIRIR